MNKENKIKKVNLLRSGQCVNAEGLTIKAIRLLPFSEGDKCDYCEMDCLCRGDIADLCEAINENAKTPYYLILGWHGKS